LNVRINAPQLADRRVAQEYLGRAQRLRADAVAREARLLERIEGRLGG
jgi:hypothetical protein